MQVTMKEFFILIRPNKSCTPVQIEKLKIWKDGDSGGGSTSSDDDIELEIELFRLYGSGTDSLETNTYDTQSSSNNLIFSYYEDLV